ncbi:MAG: hypothetical protein K8T89_27095 [Planctomycetes bacterium]|nr:hypothetical protein [Planctomycetota bacterium]
MNGPEVLGSDLGRFRAFMEESRAEMCIDAGPVLKFSRTHTGRQTPVFSLG